MLDLISIFIGAVVGITVVLTILILLDKIGDQGSLQTIRDDQTRLVNQIDQILTMFMSQSDSIAKMIEAIQYGATGQNASRNDLSPKNEIEDDNRSEKNLIDKGGTSDDEDASSDNEEERVRKEALRAMISSSDDNSKQNRDSDEELIGTHIEAEDCADDEKQTNSDIDISKTISTLTRVVENPDRDSAAELFQQIRSLLPAMPLGGKLGFLVDRLENGAMQSFNQTEESSEETVELDMEEALEDRMIVETEEQEADREVADSTISKEEIVSGREILEQIENLLRDDGIEVT